MATIIDIRRPEYSGQHVYAAIRRGGLAWDVAAGAFVPFSAAGWADHALPMPEAPGTGYFSAPAPPAIPPGTIQVTVLRRVGGSYDLDDEVIGEGTLLHASGAAGPEPAGLRARVEYQMARRMGRTLAFWGLDGATADGTNPDIGAALGRALLGMGATPSSWSDPGDAGLSTLTGAADAARLLDLTHLQLLEACLDNADVVREREGTNEQEWNGRIAELRRRIDQKRGAVAAAHGDGMGVVQGGTLTVAFLQAGPDDLLAGGG